MDRLGFFFFWLEEPKLAKVFFNKCIVQDVGMIHWCRLFNDLHCVLFNVGYHVPGVQVEN